MESTTVRCIATTKAGTQCKKRTYNHKTQKCSVHENKVPVESKIPVEFRISGLRAPNDRMLRQYEHLWKNGPNKKSDKPGWIYFYRLDGKGEDRFLKIGRTERSLIKRIREWKGSKFICGFRVLYNEWCEMVIHRLLDSHRIYRYILPDGTRHNVYKLDGTPVDGVSVDTSRCKKEIEWFFISLEIALQVAEKVCEK